MLVNNFFSALALEALIAVYLINHLTKIKLNSDDNIFRQWSERYSEKENDGPYFLKTVSGKNIMIFPKEAQKR